MPFEIESLESSKACCTYRKCEVLLNLRELQHVKLHMLFKSSAKSAVVGVDEMQTFGVLRGSAGTTSTSSIVRVRVLIRKDCVCESNCPYMERFGAQEIVDCLRSIQ